MNNSGSQELVFYLVALIVLFALIVFSALYILLRLIIDKLLISKGKPAGLFLSRLNSPTVFLLVTLCLKINALRNALPLKQNFYFYLDAAFIFSVAFFLIRFIDAIFLSWYERRKVPFPLPRVLHGFLLIVIYLIILFALLKGILGINLTPFLATSALLTMILGLAFQGVLSNILSGMSLHFTKSFTRGDWINVGNYEGIVMDTNWRETRILDRYSNIVVLPNNFIAAEKITNFSVPDKRTAIILPVKASYEAPPHLVLEAMLEAARDVPEVVTLPEPQAYITSYDDLGISYTLKFWITDFKSKHPITGDVGRLVWYNFKRRNIEIPVALADKLSDVLKTVRDKKGTVSAEEEKEQIFHYLLNSTFLRFQEGEKEGDLLVSENEIRELASLVRREKFTRGEILFKQGDRGESCFIVAEGLIRGEICYEEKGKKYLSTFKVKSGGIFGEMSLFTGVPRTATGIIEEESELLEIKTKDFALLLDRNPKLADVIAEIVSARNIKNQEFLEKIKELSEKDLEKSCNKKSILEHLKRFVLLLKK